MVNNYSISLAKPDFNIKESNAVRDVIKSGWLFQGPKVEEFENNYCKMFNVKHSIAVNSGSAALLIAQIALGISRNDEIIVPDMTFVSTASSSLFLGAKPIFVDINLNDYNIDCSKIITNITI